MFQIGDKVIMDADTKDPLEGYIVAITIDPTAESEVEFEKKDWIGYKVRVYNDLYNSYGYMDYDRDGWGLEKAVNENVV